MRLLLALGLSTLAAITSARTQDEILDALYSDLQAECDKARGHSQWKSRNRLAKDAICPHADHVKEMKMGSDNMVGAELKKGYDKAKHWEKKFANWARRDKWRNGYAEWCHRFAKDKFFDALTELKNSVPKLAGEPRFFFKKIFSSSGDMCGSKHTEVIETGFTRDESTTKEHENTIKAEIGATFWNILETKLSNEYRFKFQHAFSLNTYEKKTLKIEIDLCNPTYIYQAVAQFEFDDGTDHTINGRYHYFSEDQDELDRFRG